MSLYDRAAIIPGRSMTRSKAPDRLIRAWAMEADGAEITDTEGRTYIDTLSALGAVSLGYTPWSYPNQEGYGVLSLPHEYEIDAGEAVLQHVAPWASSVRFFKTGSAATACAYRVAKRATRRGVVLMGDWAYHGNDEWSDEPDYPWTFRFRHGAMPRHLRAHEKDVAAVFVEPHRWAINDVEWLQALRAYCDEIGALLVFDSMIYGGRWALGGASEYFGVQPDLECFGKAFGNGQSVAFVVGRGALAEHGELASGTYSGDATGLAAVCETLKVYTSEPVIETLWERGRQLQTGLRSVIPADLAAVEGQPVHQRIRFLGEESTATYDYRTSERVKAKLFREEMAKRGVLMLPDAINVMYAHTPEQIETVIQAAKESAEAVGAHV